MIESAVSPVEAASAATMSFSPVIAPQRSRIDAALLRVFDSKRVRRWLKEGHKLQLAPLGALAFKEVQRSLSAPVAPADTDALHVHRCLIDGLPGQSLFVAAALAFDTLGEALPHFDMTAKTAWHKLDGSLSTAQSEQVMRLGRAAILAAHVLADANAGRRYLRTPNFALGGEAPLALLRTADGEQMVLSELQTQADGGPV